MKLMYKLSLTKRTFFFYDYAFFMIFFTFLIYRIPTQRFQAI